MSNAKDPFVEIAAGAAVFKEGEAGAELYIIESGQVDLVSRSDTATATLGPGDFLGEAALTKGGTHGATAQARTKARLLRIEAAALTDVLRENGEIGLRLLQQLAARHLQGEKRLRELGMELARFKAATRPEPPAPAPPVTAAPRPEPPRPEAPRASPRLALRVVASGDVLALDPARMEFLVGRPDPVSGTTPEIDLGPFDANRTLSRRHARILRDGGQYCIREDTATTNGTYLNNERLQTGTAVPLKPGDKLRFGSIEVEVVAGEEAP